MTPEIGEKDDRRERGGDNDPDERPMIAGFDDDAPADKTRAGDADVPGSRTETVDPGACSRRQHFSDERRVDGPGHADRKLADDIGRDRDRIPREKDEWQEDRDD